MKIKKKYFTTSITCALFLLSNLFSFAQKDYSYYYSKKTPEGMDKKAKKAEMEENEYMANAYLQNPNSNQNIDSVKLTNLFFHFMTSACYNDYDFNVEKAKKYRRVAC